jgi:hypothetical protein
MVLDPQPPRQEQRAQRRSNRVIGRLTSETNQAFKATEFFAYVLARAS